MPPIQDDETKSQIGVYVPNDVKEALFLLSHARTEPRNNVTVSGLARDYILEGLEKEDDLPGEVVDLLDEDMIANAGGESEEADA